MTYDEMDDLTLLAAHDSAHKRYSKLRRSSAITSKADRELVIGEHLEIVKELLVRGLKHADAGDALDRTLTMEGLPVGTLKEYAAKQIARLPYHHKLVQHYISIAQPKISKGWDGFPRDLDIIIRQDDRTLSPMQIDSLREQIVKAIDAQGLRDFRYHLRMTPDLPAGETYMPMFDMLLVPSGEGGVFRRRTEKVEFGPFTASGMTAPSVVVKSVDQLWEQWAARAIKNGGLFAQSLPSGLEATFHTKGETSGFLVGGRFYLLNGLAPWSLKLAKVFKAAKRDLILEGVLQWTTREHPIETITGLDVIGGLTGWMDGAPKFTVTDVLYLDKDLRNESFDIRDRVLRDFAQSLGEPTLMGFPVEFEYASPTLVLTQKDIEQLTEKTSIIFKGMHDSARGMLDPRTFGTFRVRDVVRQTFGWSTRLITNDGEDAGEIESLRKLAEPGDLLTVEIQEGKIIAHSLGTGQAMTSDELKAIKEAMTTGDLATGGGLLAPQQCPQLYRVPMEKKLSDAERKAYERETAEIAERKKQPDAKERHKFLAARWTHGNGHPRCKVCGGEETFSGYCNAHDLDERVARAFDAIPHDTENWDEVLHRVRRKILGKSAYEQIMERKAADREGCMIAFMVPPEVGALIARAQGEPVENLHVTLAYLGKLDELPEDHHEKLVRAMESVARESAPLKAKVAGIGRFEGNREGDDVIHALVDAPMMNRFREDVVAAIEKTGLPLRRDHGFIPHITLAYVTWDAPTPQEPTTGIELTFDRVAVVSGNKATFVPLTGSAKHDDDLVIEKYAVLKSEILSSKAGKEQRYTLGVAYPAKEVDVHGEYMNPEELELAAWRAMQKGIKIGVQHKDGTDGAGVPVESYIYRGPDWDIAGQKVEAGDWLLGVIWDEKTWDEIKTGKLTGFSFQGYAKRQGH